MLQVFNAVRLCMFICVHECVAVVVVHVCQVAEKCPIAAVHVCMYVRGHATLSLSCVCECVHAGMRVCMYVILNCY